MDFCRAERFLSDFPHIYRAVIIKRHNLIYGGGSRDYATTRRRTTSGDPTAKRAIELANMADLIKTLAVTRRWVDHHLPPSDRLLLLCRWRGLPWETVSRRIRKAEVQACQKRWITLVKNYKAYAGRAIDVDGNAFAAGRR